MTSNELNELLDVVAKVLVRCFVLAFLIVLLWFFAYMLGRDLIYRQAGWFHLTAHEVDLVFYCGMGLVKTINLLFFLLPWVAIRLVLAKRRK